MRSIAITTIGDRPAAITVSDNSPDPVKIWDVATGNALGKLPTRAAEAVVAATVDGQPIAVTTSYQTVRVWKLTTRKQIGPDLHFPKPVRAVAISEDGHIIVCFDRDIAVFTNTPAPPERMITTSGDTTSLILTNRHHPNYGPSSAAAVPVVRGRTGYDETTRPNLVSVFRTSV